MFNLGDKVVYPMHGAGLIESIEEKVVLGETKKYYSLSMPVGGIKLMIPVDNVEKMGLRNIISKGKIKDVLKILEKKAEANNENWNKRYRDNLEKMRTGDIYELAEVVRDLYSRDKSRGLSTGEKKMLMNARQILISEIVLSSEKSRDEVIELVDKHMNKK